MVSCGLLDPSVDSSTRCCRPNARTISDQIGPSVPVSKS